MIALKILGAFAAFAIFITIVALTGELVLDFCRARLARRAVRDQLAEDYVRHMPLRREER